MIKNGFATSLIAILLSGCSAELFPALDPRIDEAPLNAESRAALRDYFNKPNSKSFVFSTETGENWHAWGYGSAAEAEAISLSKCEELTGTRCTVFARNAEIVWRSEGAATDTSASTVGASKLQATTQVNMRGGPGTNFAVVAVLTRGETLEARGSEGVWREVRRTDGSLGFVHSDYLSPVAATPAASSSTDDRLDRSTLRALRQDAEDGSVDAQFDLGNRYLHAFGVSKDVVEAREWFVRAADQGHPVAAYELGLMYEKGTGVEPDSQTALRWFRQAANAGHAPSQDKLR